MVTGKKKAAGSKKKLAGTPRRPVSQMSKATMRAALLAFAQGRRKAGPSRPTSSAGRTEVRARRSLASAGGGSVSMVNDGVNVGSVWKNTTSERVAFPLAREKVADLTSASTAFQLLSQLYVNPGNSTLFPIFSQIAGCYEEYVPTTLKFIFRSEEYMASGSTVSAGIVGMGTAFDANDANFPNITSLENYEHSISGPPFSGVIVHDVLAAHRRRFRGKARDLSLNNYFVYPSANSIGPSTDQAKWYDVGNFQVACNGCQAGLMGELWVEYAFTLIRRKQPEFPVGGSAIHFNNPAGDATAAAGLGLTPFTSSSVRPGSTLSIVDMAGDLGEYTSSTIGLNDVADTRLNLPNASAVWLVVIYWNCTGVAAVPSATAAGGATILSAFNGTAGLGFFTAAGTTAGMSKVVSTVATAVPDSTSNSIIVGGLTTMTAGTVSVHVSRLPNNLVTLTERAPAQTRLDQLEATLASLVAARPRHARSAACESDGESDDDGGITGSVVLARKTVAAASVSDLAAAVARLAKP